MNQSITIGLDSAKNVFQLHGVDAGGGVCLVRRLRRGQVLGFFSRQPACVVGLEACSGSNHWAREITKLGHEVRLVPPAFVKRFLGRNKNDAADARAIAEAAMSPHLRSVPVRSAEEQAGAMALKARGHLVRQHTQTGNLVRSQFAEFGLCARAGDAGLQSLIAMLEEGRCGLPHAAMAALGLLINHWRAMGEAIAVLDRQVIERVRADKRAQRLTGVPGVGPITALAFLNRVPDPARFSSARDCAAWLGLTPKEHSSAERRSLGHISKQGHEDLRALLVLGAASVLMQAKRRPHSVEPWVAAIISRKPFKLAAVALAARNARTLFAMLASGKAFDMTRRMQKTLLAA